MKRLLAIRLLELKQLIKDAIDESYVKPPYPGKFIGQSFVTNDKVVRKRVQITDRMTGEKIWVPVAKMQKVTLVWDGKDWLDEHEFDLKMTNSPAAKPGGKESIDDFIRRGGKVRRIG